MNIRLGEKVAVFKEQMRAAASREVLRRTAAAPPIGHILGLVRREVLVVLVGAGLGVCAFCPAINVKNLKEIQINEIKHRREKVSFHVTVQSCQNRASSVPQDARGGGPLCVTTLHARRLFDPIPTELF